MNLNDSSDVSKSAKLKRTPFPGTFWVANTMEIFERLAWYGFYALSTLYITAPVIEGGLGFTSEQRGVIQGLIPFILYLLPVLTGALADRYGYKRTFFLAYAIMVPSYFLLGQFKSFEGFLFAFLLVALGAATFKPVVVGTVARTTDKTNSSIGFGIFYMMVNIGGFFGPMVAGYIRGWSWNYVFLASSIWIGCNFIWLMFFYKEPTTEATAEQKRTFKKVLSDIVDVLGNGRFFLTVIVIIILLLGAGREWIGWGTVIWLSLAWVALNFLVDIPLRKSKGEKRGFLVPMRLGNWRFALFLLILSGFWTSFNQIFITMPEYIRDFVDTSDMLEGFVGPLFNALARVNPDVVIRVVQESIAQFGTQFSPDQLTELSRALLEVRVRLTPEQLQPFFAVVSGALTVPSDQLLSITNQLIESGKQVNPEYIVNFDAGAIVIFQVLVSWAIARWKPFNTMVVGTIIAAIGIGMSAWLHSGWPIVVAIVVFAFGEMMASPKSQEYIGRIAPEDKKALYMGYYFVAIALGNLFGGLMSGQLYGKLARDLHRPDIMWVIFGIVGLVTALALILYDRLVIRKLKEGENVA